MNRIFCFALLFTVNVIVGCGGGAEGGKPVFPASGTVTMFGKPLAKATVAFAPQGDQPTAIGTTDKDGNFQLTTYDYGDGAAEGSFKVVISKAAAAATGGEDQEGADHDSDVGIEHASSEEAESGVTLVPAQYSNTDDTPFTADVKSSGDNVFTFEIK